MGIVFKGSGFYRTDSRAASSASEGAKEPAAAGAAKADSTPRRRRLVRQPPVVILVVIDGQLVGSGSATSGNVELDLQRRAPDSTSGRLGIKIEHGAKTAASSPGALAGYELSQLAASHALQPGPPPDGLRLITLQTPSERPFVTRTDQSSSDRVLRGRACPTLNVPSATVRSA